MTEGKFGFVQEDDEDLALQFQPTPVNRSAASVEEVDRVAAAVGFTSRERLDVPAAAQPRRRRTVGSPLTRSITVKMSEAEFGRFLKFADRVEATYGNAISLLLDLAGEVK